MRLTCCVSMRVNHRCTLRRPRIFAPYALERREWAAAPNLSITRAARSIV